MKLRLTRTDPDPPSAVYVGAVVVGIAGRLDEAARLGGDAAAHAPQPQLEAAPSHRAVGAKVDAQGRARGFAA